MNEELTIEIQLGKVSKYIEVNEFIVRQVPKYGVTEEFDGEADDESGEVEYEFRLQGRISNNTSAKLSDIQYDVSYYDLNDKFLGMNKCRFLEEDELDADDYMAIDMKVLIPEHTYKCIFNTRAKKAGIFSRLFWG